MGRLEIDKNSIREAIAMYDGLKGQIEGCQSHADASYITGELGSYYGGLGDNTKEQLNALATNLSNAPNMARVSLDLYDYADKVTDEYLESLINEIFENIDANIKEYHEGDNSFIVYDDIVFDDDEGYYKKVRIFIENGDIYCRYWRDNVFSGNGKEHTVTYMEYINGILKVNAVQKYDYYGHLVEEDYEDGTIIKYEYDFGYLKSKFEIFPDGTRIEWEFYGKNNVKSVLKILPDGTSEEKTYDEKGNLKSESKISQDGTRKEWRYDENGNLKSISEISPDGEERKYDENGNLIGGLKFSPDGTVIEWEYDEDGNKVTSIRDGETMDEQKRIIEYPDGTVVEATYDENCNLVNETYTYPDGTSESYDYSPLGENESSSEVDESIGVPITGSGKINNSGFDNNEDDGIPVIPGGNNPSESTTNGGNDSDTTPNTEPTPDVVDPGNDNTTPNDPIIGNPSEEESPIINNPGSGNEEIPTIPSPGGEDTPSNVEPIRNGIGRKISPDWGFEREESPIINNPGSGNEEIPTVPSPGGEDTPSNVEPIRNGIGRKISPDWGFEREESPIINNPGSGNEEIPTIPSPGGEDTPSNVEPIRSSIGSEISPDWGFER